MPDNTLSTLAQIRTKVRRLTRTPSTNQMSDADLDSYINTFVLYDFPENLRLSTFSKKFTFVTSAFIDRYSTDLINANNQFNNFKNQIISIHPPVYADGELMGLSQSNEQFYNLYPEVTSIQDTVLRGNGVLQQFAGTVPAASPNNVTLLQYKVMFSALDVNNLSQAKVDVPLVDAVTGRVLSDQGNLYNQGEVPTTPPTVLDPANTINYLTGAFTVTFDAAPAVGEIIFANTVPTTAGKPTTILFYNNEFTLRPVPDKAYKIEMNAYIRPTELMLVGDMPELSQWWQYIAISTAKKIFEDRLDIESVQMIMPMLKEQERLALRRTIVQQSNERTATIFTNGGTGFFNSNSYRG